MDRAGKLRIMGISASTALLAAFIAVFAIYFSSSARGGEVSMGCPFSGEGGTGSFVLHGTVLNSSFHNATTNATQWNASVNVSVYNMTFSNFGEPQKTFVNYTTTTTMNGSFSIGISSGSCAAMYTITTVAYNVSSWNAWEIGPSLPPLPAIALLTFFDNSTIYLQPAATLNITAYNLTDANPYNNISFNYVLFDDSLGFPLAENFQTLAWNASVVVPRSKNYTIMMMRSHQQGQQNPFSTALPPQSFRLQNISNYSNSEYRIAIDKNLSFDMFTISGNISIEGNSTPVNVSQILVKLGIAGMVPPNSDVNIPGGTVINQTSGGEQHVANYSISTMGSSSGIYQILEFYGANSTSAGPGTGDYFAYFSNFTVSSNMIHNVTLKRLAGNYSEVSGFTNLNTSFVTVNITDSNNQPLSDAHLELKVDMVGHKTVFPTFRYMVDQLSGGLMRLPMLNDSNATLLVYNRQYAPLKFKINITNASREPNGIIHLTMNAFKPRKFNPDGSKSEFSGSLASSFKLTFLRNSGACNVFNVSVDSCRLFPEDFDGAAFNPLKVMATGKVNILSEINTTGVKVYFIGVDMIASGPPEASISDSALRKDTNGSSFQELFKFGSVAPNIYDVVVVGMPYNYSRIDDSQPINFTIKELFDDTGNMVWNSSSFPNGQSIPDAWSDYNVSFFNVSSGGLPCLKDADSANLTNTTCFVNTTTNYLWVKLPHFSDGSGGPSGSDATPPAAPAVVNVSAVLSGNVMINWTDVPSETGESYLIFRSVTNISRFWNNLTNYTANFTNITSISGVGEGVQTYVDNATLNGTIYFYFVAAVDASGNLQNATPQGGINLSSSYGANNVTVNDSVIPRVPDNLTATTSGSTVTLYWRNVTQDVSGGSDWFNITYYVYKSDANQSVNISGNVTLANITGFVKSIATNTTSVTGLANGVYHFAIVTADDGGNVNLSVTPLNYVNISVTPSSSSSSSSSSGSSSGGGSGGGSNTPTSEGTKVSKRWDSLPAGIATMTIGKDDISFKSIDITVDTPRTGVDITVTALAEPPVVKRAVQGKVYQYIKIDKTGLVDSDVTQVKVEFKIEKKWFDANNGNVKNVVLQRYTSDLWTSLTTTYLRSDVTYQYFQATSPGLSIFAVVLKQTDSLAGKTTEVLPNQDNAPGNESLENEAADAGEAAAKAKGRKKLALFAVIAIVIAAALAGAFFLVRKKGGGISIPNPLGKFKRSAQAKTAAKSEDEEAAKIVKEYESQAPARRQEQDQRGRPPEAFN